MKQRLYLIVILAAASTAQSQVQYTGDGVPLTVEEEIRWRVNRGRFDSASENQMRRTSYTDVPASSGPLAPNHNLRLAAQHHTADMGAKNIFQHETIPGSAYYNPTTQPTPWDRMRAEGYSYNAAAENIAAGYSSAEAAYVGWWKSTGHRVNMYNSGLREIGIGYVLVSSGYGHYYTMDLGSAGTASFFTDTLFRDANSNGVYNAGEGVSNVVISLVAGPAVHSAYDISSPAGSFAVPLSPIPTGATVHVVLSNANLFAVTLSVPRNFSNYVSALLGPRERCVYGTFIKASQARNVGLREVAPIPSASRLAMNAGSTSTTLTWASQPGTAYEVQWSTNLAHWNSLTNVQAAAGNAITISDAAGSSQRPKRFYRLLLR